MADQILKKLQMPDGNTYVFNASLLEDQTLDQIKAAIKQEVQVETVQYLGLVNSLSGLSTTAGYGDFHRVSEGFEDQASGIAVHAGDLLVAAKANPEQNLDESNWVLVHGEEGNLISHKHNVTVDAQTLYNEAHSHTFTGAEATLNYTPSGTVSISKGTGAANYTPAGTITLSGTTDVASKTADVASKDHTHEVAASGSYTPEGTIEGSFIGTTMNSEGSAQATSSEAISVAKGDHVHTASCVPQGSVSVEMNTSQANTDAIKVGEYNASNQTLSFVAATKADFATNVKTSSFSGSSTAVNVVANENVVNTASYDHSHNVSVSGTTTGSISGLSFKGIAATINVNGNASASTSTTIAVASSDHTHGVGTLSAAFSGTGVELKGAFTGTQGNIVYTPVGTISDTTIKVDFAKQIVTSTNPINAGDDVTEQLNMSLSSLVDVEV